MKLETVVSFPQVMRVVRVLNRERSPFGIRLRDWGFESPDAYGVPSKRPARS